MVFLDAYCDGSTVALFCSAAAKRRTRATSMALRLAAAGYAAGLCAAPRAHAVQFFVRRADGVWTAALCAAFSATVELRILSARLQKFG